MRMRFGAAMIAIVGAAVFLAAGCGQGGGTPAVPVTGYASDTQAPHVSVSGLESISPAGVCDSVLSEWHTFTSTYQSHLHDNTIDSTNYRLAFKVWLADLQYRISLTALDSESISQADAYKALESLLDAFGTDMAPVMSDIQQGDAADAAAAVSGSGRLFQDEGAISGACGI